MKNMQLYQLSCFITVAEKRNFSKAAESLFLSQSTVSTHIGNLEKYFGQKLFDRLGNKSLLTPFGEKLYRWAKEIIELKDTALWDLREQSSIMQGQIKIIASTVPAQYIVPLLISRFIKKHAQVQFVLLQENSKKVAESLLKGAGDLGLLGEKYYTDKVQYTACMQEKLVLITPVKVTLQEPISILDLSDYPFIFRNSTSGTQTIIEKIFQKSQVKLADFKIAAYFDTVQAIKQGVKEGIGISIISEIAARDYYTNKFINVYKLKEINKKRTFYFAYNRQKTLSPLVKEFLSFSCDYLSKQLTF